MAIDQVYAERDGQKREGWSMKMHPRTKYLATIAARAQGKTLSSFVEDAMVAAFKSIVILRDDETEDDTAKTLADLADDLYTNSEPERFLSLIAVAPWLVSDGEGNLLRILRHSDYFFPRGVPHTGRICEQWVLLREIRDGRASMDVLRPEHQPNADLVFGLQSDAERIAFHNNDSEAFKAAGDAYQTAMKKRMRK